MNSNPFFNRVLLAQQRGKNRGRRRNFSPSPQEVAIRTQIGPEGLRTQGADTFLEPAPNGSVVLNKGRRSAYNPETPLHNNAITLVIKNNSSTTQADIILTAGRFDSDSNYSAQVISDGTASYPNNDSTNVSVSVSADFGVDGAVSTWEEFKRWIKEDGIAISALRISYLTHTQRAKKVKFRRRELFGDDSLDYIFPEAIYNPNQYDSKVIQTEVAFALDSKTILAYSLVPSEEVTLTMWVDVVYEKERVLQDYIRRNKQKSLG